MALGYTNNFNIHINTMAKINSKKKGSKNERNLAKLFEKWTGREFARTPSSGGLRWSNTNDTAGDIICSDKTHSRYFKFVIEAKSYKDINFEQLLLDNKNKKILEFWEQVLADAKRAENKIPILLMRYNGMPRDFHFIVFSKKAYEFVFKPAIKYINKELWKKFEVEIPGYSLVIITSTMLFATDYESVHKFAKKYLKNEKKEKNQ